MPHRQRTGTIDAPFLDGQDLRLIHQCPREGVSLVPREREFPQADAHAFARLGGLRSAVLRRAYERSQLYEHLCRWCKGRRSNQRRTFWSYGSLRPKGPSETAPKRRTRWRPAFRTSCSRGESSGKRRNPAPPVTDSQALLIGLTPRACAYHCDVVHTFPSSSRFGWSTYRTETPRDRECRALNVISCCARLSRSPSMCGNTAGIGGKQKRFESPLGVDARIRSAG